MRKAKIICTIGPASREVDVLRGMVRSGMDVARLNFSHGDAETHRETVKRIRFAAKAENHSIAILVDLQGPKFRMGRIIEPGVFVSAGDTITLTTEDLIGDTTGALPVQNQNLPVLVKPGDFILIDDGLIELRVLSTTSQKVQCQVVVGGNIQNNKGINLPGISADLPSMTEKDRQDLIHALDLDVDWIALSFVRRAEDVVVLKKSIRELTDRHLPVMAKIEKPEALDNIDQIIEAADAIMVARGDLGIEIPTEQVPMSQKRIIERCNEAGIPVVTATQMLDSMIRNPRPTRAEASDVANAILDGTDAVMLSGETSIGRYPMEALQTMTRIICEVEEKQTDIPARPFRPHVENVDLSIARAVGSAARDVAYNLDLAAIIAVTASGYTARMVSRYRPRAPIIAITSDERVQRQVNLCWGVTPLLAPRTHNTDEMIANALQTVRKYGLVEKGDLAAITAGTAGSEPGTTNLLQILVIQ
jgi:pyruvate kinase